MQAACKPDSVPDDHSSRRRVTAALQQPTRKFRQDGETVPHEGLSACGAPGRYAGCAGECACHSCLFGLAPCGVYHATLFTQSPVRSYRTLSPLPAGLAPNRRYAFCCTGRPDGLNHPSRTLSGTLPCGVRTFLPRSIPEGLSGSDRPAACNPECIAGKGLPPMPQHPLGYALKSIWAWNLAVISRVNTPCTDID